MKKLILMVIIVCGAFNAASAQFEATPDSSFGKPVKFLGHANAGLIQFYHTCDARVLQADLELILGPDDRCLVIPTNGQLASAQLNDIGRITLPAGSFENVVYLIANHSMSYNVLNNLSAPAAGSLSYTPSITIESVALNDPQAIDPYTGLPMNGSYTTTGYGTKAFYRTYPQGAMERISESYSRANTGGISREFFAALGLPRTVIREIYRNPMTIRLNVLASGRLLSFGQFRYSIRVTGN